jgi:hypothetical protein
LSWFKSMRGSHSHKHWVCGKSVASRGQNGKESGKVSSKVSQRPPTAKEVFLPRRRS